MNSKQLSANENDRQFSDHNNYLIGFVAVLVGLGAFKDELFNGHIRILNIWPTWFSLIAPIAVFLLIAAWLNALIYLTENFTRSGIAIHVWLRRISLGLNLLALLVWPIMLITLLGYSFVASRYVGFLSSVLNLVPFALGTLAAIFTGKLTQQVEKGEINKALQLVRKLKEKGLENSEKLYKQKFYSSSILEAYKTIELTLAGYLIRRGAISSTTPNVPFKYVLEAVVDLGYLEKNDINLINEIRILRNKAAHLDINLTKNDADFVISSTRSILKKFDESAETYDSEKIGPDHEPPGRIN